EPRKHRFADEKVADIELDDLRQRRDDLGTCVIESMTGVNLEAEPCRQLCPLANPPPLRLSGLFPSVGDGVAPRAGMQLDHWCADRGGGFDLSRVRRNEQRDTDTLRAEPGDCRGQSMA